MSGHAATKHKSTMVVIVVKSPVCTPYIKIFVAQLSFSANVVLFAQKDQRRDTVTIRLATVAVESHAIRAHCVVRDQPIQSLVMKRPKQTVWASRFKKPSNLVKAMTQAT